MKPIHNSIHQPQRVLNATSASMTSIPAMKLAPQIAM
jgi:hypothetical protein